MAFPTVEARAITQIAASTTTHNVNLPASIAAGDLLLIIFGHNNFADPTGTPAGWTQLSPPGQAANNDVRFRIYYKEATGSEGATVAITTNLNGRSTSVAHRISGANTTPEGVAETTGTSSTADPPALTPALDVQDYLWIAYCCAGEGDANVDSAPASYSNLQNATTGVDPEDLSTGSAERNLNASNENPGTFGLSASNNWVATTVAVAPATLDTTYKYRIFNKNISQAVHRSAVW